MFLQRYAHGEAKRYEDAITAYSHAIALNPK
jgi:tetratricopeptide (TPR) repeat protein